MAGLGCSSHVTTPEIPHPTFETLDRYLRGEATHAERVRVDAWIQDDPRRRALLIEAATAVRVPDGMDLTNDDALKGIKRRIAEIESTDGVARPAPVVRDGAGVGARLGRRAIGLLTGSVLAFGVVIMALIHSWTGHTADVTSRRYTTGIAEVRHLQLPDGSTVTLAPQTSLVLAPDFGKTTRDIVLRGEAYFEVAAQVRAPMTIEAGGLRTRVLGTAFAVRHYASDSATRIAVAQGRVMITRIPRSSRVSQTPGVVLVANMVGLVTDSTILVEERPNVSPYVMWTRDGLTFDETPVPQVLAALGPWYGVAFVLKDSVIARQHLTATINYRNTADMLNALKDMLDVTMTFHGDTAVLTAPHPVTARRRIHGMADSLLPPNTREAGR